MMWWPDHIKLFQGFSCIVWSTDGSTPPISVFISIGSNPTCYNLTLSSCPFLTWCKFINNSSASCLMSICWRLHVPPALVLVHEQYIFWCCYLSVAMGLLEKCIEFFTEQDPYTWNRNSRSISISSYHSCGQFYHLKFLRDYFDTPSTSGWSSSLVHGP